MQELNFLQINQRLEIKLKNSEIKYLSRIEDIKENKILIAIPLKAGEIVPLEKGTLIDVITYREDALYIFESSIIGRETLNNLPVLAINKPVDFKRVQRRSFYRLDIALPIKYRVLKAPYSISNEPFFTAITKDISGGGVSIVVDRTLVKDTILELVIELPQEEIDTIGRVVIVKGKEDTKKIVGIEFVGIEEPQREKIIKFIFQKQLEQRRKQLWQRETRS